MWKWCLRITSLCLILFSLWYHCYVQHRFFRQFQSIKVGMSLKDVEAILGPGLKIPQHEVPRSPDYHEPNLTERCAKKVKLSQASIRPEQRKTEPNDVSVADGRQPGGTPGATLPGPGIPGCASPHA